MSNLALSVDSIIGIIIGCLWFASIGICIVYTLADREYDERDRDRTIKRGVEGY